MECACMQITIVEVISLTSHQPYLRRMKVESPDNAVRTPTIPDFQISDNSNFNPALNLDLICFIHYQYTYISIIKKQV